jgi:hypothetical protein
VRSPDLAWDWGLEGALWLRPDHLLTCDFSPT